MNYNEVHPKAMRVYIMLNEIEMYLKDAEPRSLAHRAAVEAVSKAQALEQALRPWSSHVERDKIKGQ